VSRAGDGQKLGQTLDGAINEVEELVHCLRNIKNITDWRANLLSPIKHFHKTYHLGLVMSRQKALITISVIYREGIDVFSFFLVRLPGQ
jgi:hypothetical protein